MSFVIVAPPYRDSSSGIRALYRLCHWLNTLGQEAYVFAEPWEAPPREWDAPQCKVFPPVAADVIAVYPEIIPGNPLGAKTVVRWVLNHPGLLGGDKTYAEDEHVFYAPQKSGPDVYRASAQAAAGGREVFPLGAFIHEPHLFYPSQRNHREGTCYFIYKGAEVFGKSGGMFPTAEWHLLSPDAPVSRADLGFLFRRTEALYSWDAHSGITREAAICGVKTYIVDAQGGTTEIPQPEYREVIDDYLLPPPGIERLLEIGAE